MPQRLPPPLTHGEEAIAGDRVLRESPEDLAVALWKTVRTVSLWAELEEVDRPRAFASGAHDRRHSSLARSAIPDEIRPALSMAASVLLPRARAEAVGGACRHIAGWAANEGKLGTAIDFMQAAALVLPGDADLAYQVARLARAAVEYHRAESWYREAIRRARRSRDSHVFISGYIGLGIVFTLRGNYPQAARSLIRGLRGANRVSNRRLQAAAAHELVILGIRTERSSQVMRYALIAVDAYGPGNARLPALAHDVGIFLLNAGYLEAANRVIRTTPPDYGRPIDQVARYSALVRIAGALGNREAYAESLERAETLLGIPGTAPATAEAYLAIAQGADLIGDRETARRAANVVKQLAAERGEAQLQFAVEELVQWIEKGEDGEARATPDRPVETPREIRAFVDVLETAIGAI